MTIDELINLISNVGFPVTVAAYLLIRLEPRLTELRDAVRELVLLLRTHTLSRPEA